MMRRFGIVLLFAAAAGVLSGCMTEEDKLDSENYRKTYTEIGHIRRSLRESRNPHTFVVNARKFALEKISDLSDEEADAVQQKNPVVDSNFDGSEYSFVWTVGKHHLIEVVTTPPPCQPIEAYRVRRTFYP